MASTAKDIVTPATAPKRRWLRLAPWFALAVCWWMMGYLQLFPHEVDACPEEGMILVQSGAKGCYPPSAKITEGLVVIHPGGTIGTYSAFRGTDIYNVTAREAITTKTVGPSITGAVECFLFATIVITIGLWNEGVL